MSDPAPINGSTPIKRKRKYVRRPGKRSPGRPKKVGDRVKICTKLLRTTWALLNEIGDGEANEGIEKLAAVFRDRLYANDPAAQAEYKKMTERQWKGE